MKRSTWVLTLALLGAGISGPVFAQSFTLPPYMTHDHYVRSAKLLGMPIFNDKGEQIGTIDDVTIPSSGGEVMAVLSVGSFVGMPKKLIAVPLSHVKMDMTKGTMAGASKAEIMAFRSYDYSNVGGG